MTLTGVNVYVYVCTGPEYLWPLPHKTDTIILGLVCR